MTKQEIVTELHSAEDAIKQAVEDGRYLWKDFSVVSGEIETVWKRAMAWASKNVSEVLQDPAMWQALGKARGWKELRCNRCRTHTTIEYRKEKGGKGIGDECSDCYGKFEEEWRIHQHEWLDANDDALLLGGDMKAFWQSLP